jgi:hypothetical protein
MIERESDQDIDVPVTSREQDAVRILVLIDGACETGPAVGEVPGAVGVVRAQVRLQKLDFWLRNPDYLADELLNDYDVSGEPYLLELAGSILDSEEPEVRSYPMLRKHFGAYEFLDNALAVLRSAGLVAQRRRGTVNRVRQYDYFLLEAGRAVAREVIREAPVFDYYVQRVALVITLADGLGGTQLKERQYLQREYADTARDQRIGSVSVRARARLERLRTRIGTTGTGNHA